jgi:hypothetical protein
MKVKKAVPSFDAFISHSSRDRSTGELVEAGSWQAAARRFRRAVAVLWAYNAKNDVLLEHEDLIAAGIRVVDKRLDEARWRSTPNHSSLSMARSRR